MNTDRSATVVTVSWSAWRPCDLGQRGLDRVGHLDRVGVRCLGHGQGQRLVAVGPAVAGGRDEVGLDGAEVADRDRLRRDRRERELGRAKARSCRPGEAVGAGRPRAALKPTTRPRIWSTEVSAPIVETGIFDPSAGSWPEGRVRLLA